MTSAGLAPSPTERVPPSKGTPVKNANVVLIDRHPGRSAQTIGIARELGTDLDLIHEPSVGVVGTKGDSQCYLGVLAKVDAVHARLKSRIGKGPGQLKLRLVQPEYTIATSDGIRNGTREMRYSLIGREVDQRCALRASERDGPCRHHRDRRLRQAAGRHAGRAARAQPAGDHHVGWLDPSRHRSQDRARRSTSSAPIRSRDTPTPSTATTSPATPAPAIGSCGGMFTYNTMQTFIGVVGMQPLHMVAPPSDDPRRLERVSGRAGGPPRASSWRRT